MGKRKDGKTGSKKIRIDVWCMWGENVKTNLVA